MKPWPDGQHITSDGIIDDAEGETGKPEQATHDTHKKGKRRQHNDRNDTSAKHQERQAMPSNLQRSDASSLSPTPEQKKRIVHFLRRVLRDLEAVLQRALEGGRVLARVLIRGSKKGLSRRHQEGRNTISAKTIVS